MQLCHTVGQLLFKKIKEEKNTPQRSDIWALPTIVDRNNLWMHGVGINGEEPWP